MKKNILFILSFWAYNLDVYSQIWFAKDANVRFFSTTPIEDIEAINKYAAGALNSKTGKIYFKVMMKSFKFEKSLMQEHFNENYIESDKFPSAEFDGQIIDLPDLSKDGTYVVKLKGKFSLHGITSDREIMANLKVDGGKIIGKSNFKIRCNEHNIKIPRVVKNNIQEEIDVTLDALFLSKK